MKLKFNQAKIKQKWKSASSLWTLLGTSVRSVGRRTVIVNLRVFVHTHAHLHKGSGRLMSPKVWEQPLNRSISLCFILPVQNIIRQETLSWTSLEKGDYILMATSCTRDVTIHQEFNSYNRDLVQSPQTCSDLIKKQWQCIVGHLWAVYYGNGVITRVNVLV